MPLIDVQRRHVRTGAIRLGNRVPVSGSDKTRPNKLDSFRITSPHRAVIQAVASQFGGTVRPWVGGHGPEFEVITTVRELPVLLPQQLIDPNYELWGNKINQRLCDGQTERIRNTPCLCAQWDNHRHSFYGRSGSRACQICGLDESWLGQPHTHQYEHGLCVECGCRRPCKPTTRVNVMIRGVPSIGVFKVESHGINAAMDLTGFADLIAQTTIPLPARLVMEYVDQLRLMIGSNGQERTEARKFWVPRLFIDWLTPDMAYMESAQLEQAARAQIAISGAPAQELQAIESAPEEPQLTADDIRKRAGACESIPEVQQLWKQVAAAKALDTEASKILTNRADELKLSTTPTPDVVDAGLVEEWPETARPGGGRR
jgi:hypothetical protein